MSDIDPTARLSDLPQQDADAPGPVLPYEIGPYRVLDRREGGMGIVYIAEQSEPITRRVAVKVMKYGLDSREMLARFDSERRLLALLNHPNIAQIYEAGATSEGRPYFVMEYVDGVPITEYCDTHELSIEERLRLFQEVCHGVQQAHQKGIIHRDLKPSNILVTSIANRPVPKIIDFGIAKATDETLGGGGGAKTLFGEMLGTPEYASPEQVSMNALAVDTRSDVYSLGVVAYELITGWLPFDFRRDQMSFVDIVRVIRDEDPPAPSSLAKGSRELDWVIMRALEKDPARRYQSPAAFAEDIQRFLDKEPVEAGPPSRAYRLRKYMRRHLGAAIATAAILLTLAVSGTIFGIRLKRERDEAMRQAARAEAMNQFLFGLFDAADPYAAGFDEVEIDAAGKLIRRGVARLDVELANQPELRTEMLARLGEVLLNLNLTADGEKTLRRAVADRTRLSGAGSAETLRVRTLFGRALFMSSSYEEADRVLAAALAALRANPGAARDDVAEAARSLGRVRRARGDLKSAEALYSEALAIRRVTRGEKDIDYGSTLGDLAALKKDMGKNEEATALQRKTLEIFRGALGDQHPEVAIILNNLATSIVEDRPAEAETLLRQAIGIKQRLFGPDHIEMSALYGNLARTLAKQGRGQEARPLVDRALSIAKAGYGPNHARTARVYMNLARVCDAQQDHACAESALRRAVEINRQSLGPNALRTAESELELGKLLLKTDRPAAARPLLEHAATTLAAAHGPSHPSVVESRAQLALAKR